MKPIAAKDCRFLVIVHIWVYMNIYEYIYIYIYMYMISMTTHDIETCIMLNLYVVSGYIHLCCTDDLKHLLSKCMELINSNITASFYKAVL